MGRTFSLSEAIKYTGNIGEVIFFGVAVRAVGNGIGNYMKRIAKKDSMIGVFQKNNIETSHVYMADGEIEKATGNVFNSVFRSGG